MLNITGKMDAVGPGVFPVLLAGHATQRFRIGRNPLKGNELAAVHAKTWAIRPIRAGNQLFQNTQTLVRPVHKTVCKMNLLQMRGIVTDVGARLSKIDGTCLPHFLAGFLKYLPYPQEGN